MLKHDVEQAHTVAPFVGALSRDYVNSPTSGVTVMQVIGSPAKAWHESFRNVVFVRS
ncbi:hypothetical protein O9929_26365 [Vibrio lentus]|nr:hypothetical protein [Vibrio lentus]